MKTIDYHNVSILQDDLRVLEDIDFSAEEEEMVYLLGPVGSGKTSFIKTLYGALAIEDGHARVLGEDMLRIKTSQLPALRRRIGIVHQDLRLLPDRTIHHNLDFVLRATDWKDKEQRNERIKELLEWVELSDCANRYPHELSGGQQQCICICRAILNSPQLILADEPTGHLDQENGERVMALLDEVRRKNHCTIVLATHNTQWPVDFPGTTWECKGGHLTRIVGADEEKEEKTQE